MTQLAIAYRIAAAAAALVLLTACGDDDDATSSGSPSGVDQPLSTPAGSASASESESASPSAEPTKANVSFDADEFEFDIDSTSFAAGEYTFKVTNIGKFPHALQIDGPGVEDETTGNIEPGKSGTLTVTLEKGTYHFYCPVGDHESRGMENEIIVT